MKKPIFNPLIDDVELLDFLINEDNNDELLELDQDLIDEDLQFSSPFQEKIHSLFFT